MSPDELYTKYADCLYGHITSKVQDKKIAEEIFCRSFVYALRHHKNYDENKLRVFSWLLQIANKEIKKTGILLSAGLYQQ